MAKTNDLIINIRKIIRAIDLHSNYLSQKYGLTGPQLIICNEVLRLEKITVTNIAENVHLSKATVVSILDRLTSKELIKREKGEVDKRQVYIVPTQKLIDLYEKDPPNFLQENFTNKFKELKEWEKTLIISSFERVAEMMCAENLDAAPIIHPGLDIQS
jgi:DNA-binding MarR family transcriptional regulator